MDENKQDMDVDEFIADNKWLVRSCKQYEEEYKDCRSIKSRFHQRFVYGSFIDCSHWKNDHDNCLRWKDGNKKAFVELLKSENLKRSERLRAQKENNIWERRISPPAEWDDPLPQWMQEKMKSSYLVLKANEVNNPNIERKFCVLM